MLAPFQPSAQGPVTIVFGTFGYRKTIEGWIEHARRAGCTHYRIVCMDRRLLGHLRGAGSAEHAIDYDDILPGALRPELQMRALTPLRVRLFNHLAANGCDFIHSDADALGCCPTGPCESATSTTSSPAAGSSAAGSATN